MALYQCKACGAPLEVRDGTEVAFCPYCGMKQTLPKDPVQVMSDGTSVESLLKRAFMFLEDGNWAKAQDYCDRVLDVEPENARAYLVKLMADVKVRKREDLANMPETIYYTIYYNNNCKKILRFGDEGLVSELKGYMPDLLLLQAAISENDIETVHDLINAGADVNAKDNCGATALIAAAMNSNPDVIKVLLNAGADVNAKNNSGWTALMVAASEGHTEIVNALIKARADVNAKGISGWTALMEAASLGHTEIVNALIKARADVNAKGDIIGETALMEAASLGHTEIVNTLIKAGADVNAKNRYGETALMLAQKKGHTETVKALARFSPTQTASPTLPTSPTPPTQASGCMTLILQALTATIIIAILAAYL